MIFATVATQDPAMSDTSLSTAVNPHFLARLMALAGSGVVCVTADIVDDGGRPLIAGGGRLAAAHGAMLLGQRLKRPLEACLMAPAGIDGGAVVSVATRLLDTDTALARLLRASAGQGPSPLALLADMQFGAPLRVLMTVACHADPAVLEHSVTVALLAICMAKKLKLLAEEQRCAGLAGLLHDLGELYIAPDWLLPGRRLLSHEWAHRIGHPRIGQMLVNDLDTYPLAVGRAIAEHHERFDGSGYPRQTVGNHISAVGQAVAVAEMLAGVLRDEQPLARAELALKIVAGEHPLALVSALSGARHAHAAPAAATSGDAPRTHALADDALTDTAMRDDHPGDHPGDGAGDDDGGADDEVVRLFWRIVSALELGQNLQSGHAISSPRARMLLARTLARVQLVQRAFISTGLDFYLSRQHPLHLWDAALPFEKTVATREIAWRLRDLARDLALHTNASPDERSAFAGLINLLDDDSASHLNTPDAAAAAPRLASRTPTTVEGGQPCAP